MTITFWLLIAIIVFAYVGYPLTVALAGRLLNRVVHKGAVTPSMSVIVAAYNEAGGIVERIQNIVGCRYPSDLLEVIVASDGSSDDTVALASAIGSDRVRVLDLPRRGKAAALADAVRHATGEVLVFTDANTVFRPDALVMLGVNFADTDVGGVAGRTGYLVGDAAAPAGRGEDLYWRYDTWLKALETRTGSVVSAHGGMYAIRRELFRPVEDPAVTDDFAISTAIVAQGKRLVFEPQAIGYEEPMAESGSEFRRRVRLMTRGLRGVLLRRELLNPFRHGFYSVALGSRKVLRRLVPLTFPVLLVVSCLLASGGYVYATFAAAQVAVAALAGVGWALRHRPVGRHPILYVPFFFALANAASVAALANVLRGNRIERWTPQRHASDASDRQPVGRMAEVRVP